ncbi:MAG: ParA family protein [Desulfuromonadaceae bacterium]
MIIGMVNAKGGVGKSTCACNLAHALALRGKRVLVIDNDPQSNATSLLMGDQAPQKTLFNLLESSMAIAEVDLFDQTALPSPPITTLEQCIYPTVFGVDVLPNSVDAATLEFDLYQDPSNYGLLRRLIRTYSQEHYDYCIIDCPPTLGAIWVIMCMVAADAIIVPVAAGSRMSLDGLSSVYSAVEKVSIKANTELKFLKALINKVDLRTSASKLIVETMKKRFPGKTFETAIPDNTAIEQAEIYRTTVLKHDPQCSASKRFRALAGELIELTNG